MGKKRLTESQSKEILRAAGIPVTRGTLCPTEEEAMKVAGEIGYPVVAKLESPDILHRTDAQAIQLNIQTPEELGRSFRKVVDNGRKYNPSAEILGVSVSEVIPPGREVIIGVGRDSEFGPYLMFGLGGIFVEVLKDVSFRAIPILSLDAEAMIREVKGWEILKSVITAG